MLRIENTKQVAFDRPVLSKPYRIRPGSTIVVCKIASFTSKRVMPKKKIANRRSIVIGATSTNTINPRSSLYDIPNDS